MTGPWPRTTALAVAAAIALGGAATHGDKGDGKGKPAAAGEQDPPKPSTGSGADQKPPDTEGSAGGSKKKVKTRVVLDHVDVQRSYFEGRAALRLYMTAVTLEGGRIPIPGKDGLLFKIGGSKQRIPYVLGRFGETDGELVAAVVLEVGKEYEADFPIIADALSRHLREWPRDSRVVLARYGQNVDIDPRPRNVRSVASEVANATSDLTLAEPKLLEAVERAVGAVKEVKARPGVYTRRVVVVIGDGKDVAPEPASFTRIGKEAGEAGVRIHTVAYSPVDNRRPLLGLGELSKQSGGTFRWVRSLYGFDTQLGTLADELSGQYVATAFVPSGRIKGKKIAVSHKDLSTKSVSVPKPKCGASTCDSDQYCAARKCIDRTGTTGLFGWLLYGAGGVAALVLLLAVVGAVMGRSERDRIESQQRAAAIMQQQQQQAQEAAGHRIVAQGPQGQAIAPMMAPIAPRAAGPRQPQGRIAGVGPGGMVQQQASGADAHQPQASGFVMVMSGAGSGQKLPLRHGFLIGTGRECDLTVQDSGASTYHAQIVFDAGGGALLIDKGSTNGTFVNGTRITQMRLGHGAMIRIGSTELRFLVA
ncbi:MAG: FHA domain-containing protein [Deltaproteobacteria bacterium]|nr:FHA domain-containing protein [Deltaproteobacteria bacterium]